MRVNCAVLRYLSNAYHVLNSGKLFKIGIFYFSEKYNTTDIFIRVLLLLHFKNNLCNCFIPNKFQDLLSICAVMAFFQTIF